MLHQRFFPPKPLDLFGEKQKRHHAQCEMPHHRLVATHLEVPQADLPLCLVEHVFDRPASERDAEHRLARRRLGRVRQKVLHLVRKDVPRDDEPLLVTDAIARTS